MRSKLVRWTLLVGLGRILLLALPLLLPVITDLSLVQAAKPLDFNIATAEHLKALPGIGDAYSGKIIPQSTYSKIEDQIMAKQNSGADR
jgi:DNA uptake protein ComE-like DNA-binding protein